MTEASTEVLNVQSLEDMGGGAYSRSAWYGCSIAR